VVWCAGAATARPLAGVVAEARSPSPEALGALGAAAALAGAMLAAGVGSPVLFARGAASRDELPAMLRAAGRVVDEVVAYRAVLAEPDALRAAIEAADLLVVGSPRVAVALAAAGSAARAAPRPPFVALGPTTAAAARAAGWEPAAVAAEPTAEALVRAVVALVFTAPERGHTTPA
jgi:uroporphyrinogen-III synthase